MKTICERCIWNDVCDNTDDACHTSCEFYYNDIEDEDEVIFEYLYGIKRLGMLYE